MSNYPLISIIMPVYGVEKYIGRAIESIINQSYQNWELLIVNDGSLDKSREIAFSYAQQDKRIHLYDKLNGGLSDARNYGLQYAVGDYVHFFDSDDWVDFDTYKCLVDILNQHLGCEILIFGYYVDNEDASGKLTSRKLVFPIDYSFPKKNVDSSALIKLEPVLNFAWNKLYKLKFLKDNNYNFVKGLSVIEDIEFQSRVLPGSSFLLSVPLVKYHYMNRPRTTLSKMYNDNTMDLFLKRNSLYELMMKGLGINSDMLESRLVEQTFNSYIYGLFLLFYDNRRFFDLERDKKMLNILSNNSYWQRLPNYRPSGFLNKVKRYIILSKSPLLIKSFFLLRIYFIR